MNRQEFDNIPWGTYFWGRCEERGYSPTLTIYQKPSIHSEPMPYEYTLHQLGTDVTQAYDDVIFIEEINQPD